ncbi:histidine phosphatase family protein [Oceanirhabdus seepicola]|uniref:Histidine phosphatase family protein n=1 Tax=Oceanirhabdus seepicola TaxID=2828781 RepID=A0A9J6NUT1_9CLOT|nr:histidine phosphatase family protein [Oceanirhabdus seepicola]MCM1988239.1 histidine phosphatase family protein [Oceanirhabdus seepicola]
MGEYTELIMVRHAKVEYTPEDKERALSKEGEEQRNDVLNILKSKEIDVIYSSPYKRAIDTIKLYAEYREFEIQILDDLRERKVSDCFIDDFDSFAMKQWDDFDYKLNYGESLREVQDRGIKVIQEIIRDNKGKKIMIGTHGTFLGVLLNYYEKTCDYHFWKNLKMPAIISIILDSDEVVKSIVETRLDGEIFSVI